MTLPKKNGDNQIEFRGLFNFVYSIYAISYFFILYDEILQFLIFMDDPKQV